MPIQSLCPSMDRLRQCFTLLFIVAFVKMLPAQPPGPGGPGGPGGRGGPGGPNAPDLELVEQFDTDKDGRLDRTERDEARKWMATQPNRRGGPGGGGPGGGGRGGRRGPGGPGGGPGGGRAPVEATEGPAVSPDQVEPVASQDLYDTRVLRTLFLDFDEDDWEEELAAFKPTDVEVAAKLTVDGKVYPDVGVSFRGASSFFSIPAGQKRSLNLSIDFVDDDQRLYGYKTLNLLNCNGDASMMSSLLYSDIARQKIAAPKVNFVKVVINGRSWGIYANAQQFNKDFLKDHYGSKKGARWKVSGSPNGDGGLRYMGDDVEAYKERYEIKSKDDPKRWEDLIELCRILEETPAEDLESALAPVLDVDGTLWFLAADVALVNSDGYWTRASDYSIYQNDDGLFHIVPHDMNEAFRGSRGGGRGGPGGGRGGRGGGPDGRRGGPPGGEGFGPPGGRDGFGFGPPPGEGFGPPPGGDREGGQPGARGERGAGRGPEGGPRGEGERGGQGFGGRGFGGRGFGGPGFGGPGPDGPGFGGPGRGFGGGPGGPGGRGGPGGGGGGFELDPLVGLDNPRFPLRSKLLANENLKQRYLQYVRQIANDYLDWDYLGKKVASSRDLIGDEVEADTRKLMSNEAFASSTDEKEGQLREFCDKRSAFLLGYEAIRDLPEN